MRQVWKYKLDHLAFWATTLFFYAVTRKHLLDSSGWGYYLADVVIRNLILAFACYFNIYYLFERCFRRGRYAAYGGTLVLLLVAYTALQNQYQVWFDGVVFKGEASSSSVHSVYYNFSIGVFYLVFTLALELSKRWYKQQLLLHKVQTEKLQTELKYLKAQLNPHFLFNSINTIYFQIDKSNTAARESLEKFSELLRYQLYECNEDRIPIEKETGYLENYVGLQMLRKNGNNKILFSKDETVKKFSIAPLLLLPFVENAFKHLSNHSDRNNIIELDMTAKNGYFLFCVTNSVDAGVGSDNGSGIGLKNARRRLDLLYESRHRLDIKRTDNSFSVELQIKIE